MADPRLLGGRYRLLSRVDQAGTTWQARDERAQRDVTVADARQPLPRLSPELRHPSVVAVLDVVPGDGRAWVVTEPVPGHPLARVVRSEGPLGVEAAARLGLDLLGALEAAHRAGVWLLVGPDTVTVTPDGWAVVTWFAASPRHGWRDLAEVLSLASGVSEGPLAALVGRLISEPGLAPDVVRGELDRLLPRRHPVRRKPVMWASAVLAVLVAGVGVGVALLPGDDAPRKPQAAASSTASGYVDPPPFATRPDPCTLLSPVQLEELDVETVSDNTVGSEECVFGHHSRFAHAPRSMQFLLTVKVKRYSDADQAHKALFELTEQTTRGAGTGEGVTRTKPRPVTGVGGEAVAGEVIMTGSFGASVITRVGNLMVTAQYGRGSDIDTGDRAAQGAMKAAGWLVESLLRSR
ncbi:hypothetical protein SAMN05421505_10630 [Sinosporangium album]|uniref:Protein kinase domain-containing protein n=1 Tax=Sinosporangium album TaxID=504805 RepID=A0A1G7VTI9_9ACTN|nr:hypothetical protein [Sinosporangium album]SDG62848.1 hypothetical protein SAMN05421505_10630 [Sinosporangium album]